MLCLCEFVLCFAVLPWLLPSLVVCVQLAPAFVQQATWALHAHHSSNTQQHNSSSSSETAAQPRLSSAALLQYLPLPGEVANPFLAETAAAMLRLLQEQPCVLAESGQLSKASDTVLPSSLLLKAADGQQLISNEWLQQGLQGTQFVHPELLAGSTSSSSSRAEQVLLQLGSEQFSAPLLVRWLTAPSTRQLLEALPLDQRDSWLKDLYSCLSRLRLQPAGCPMSLTDDSYLARQLAAAPILQLHGSRQLVSCNSLQERPYMWQTAFGGEAELCLFSSGGSGGLNFVHSSTLSYETRMMLHGLLQLPFTPMPVLLDELLRQQQQQQQKSLQEQEVQEAVNDHNDRMLLFLLANVKHLRSNELQQLRQRLLLCSCRRGAYVMVHNLHLPLSGESSSSTAVPVELQPDLVQAGMNFLHSSYQQLAAAAAADSAGDLWQLLRNLGVHELTTDAAALKLLQLYASDRSRRAIRLQQHLRHISFLASAEGLLLKTCNGLRNGQLRLYSSDQHVCQEGPEAQPNALHWPPSGIAAGEVAAAITQQLQHGCGLLFVHSCYRSSAGSGNTGHGRLMRFVVKEAGPDEVGVDAVGFRLCSCMVCGSYAQQLAPLAVNLACYACEVLSVFTHRISSWRMVSRHRCINRVCIVASAACRWCGSCCR
jgi:hypothetical protein